ncbi:helix-turn-helix domain-containing protein [Nocardia fusca]|uniref:helix-turn-helix domain-containing protein n=1 Tax=Nocardia fusca TaxID=941183 RepID=UPI0012F48F30|nr:helix-turn-helix domain-containing protein [Nocardia fusca]
MLTFPEGFPLMLCEQVMGPYPRGNAGEMWAGAAAWSAAQQACSAEADRLDAVAASVPGRFGGAAGAELQRSVAGLVVAKRRQAEFCESVAEQCAEGALGIDLGQVTWRCMAFVLVAELVADMFLAGGAPVAAAAHRAAARAGWRVALMRLVELLTLSGERFAGSRAAMLVGAGVLGAGLGGGITWGAQVWQQVQGRREEIDWQSVVTAGAGGVAGGVAGAGVFCLRPVNAVMARLHGSGTRAGTAGAVLFAGGVSGVAGGVGGAVGAAGAASVYAGRWTAPQGSEMWMNVVNGVLEGLISGGAHTVHAGRTAAGPRMSDLPGVAATTSAHTSFAAVRGLLPVAASVDPVGAAGRSGVGESAARAVADLPPHAPGARQPLNPEHGHAAAHPVASSPPETMAEATPFPPQRHGRASTIVPTPGADLVSSTGRSVTIDPTTTVHTTRTDATVHTFITSPPDQDMRVSWADHSQTLTQYPLTPTPGDPYTSTAFPASTGPTTTPPATVTDPTSAHTPVSADTAPSAVGTGHIVDAEVRTPAAPSPTWTDGPSDRQPSIPWIHTAEQTTRPGPRPVEYGPSPWHPDTRRLLPGNPRPEPTHSAPADAVEPSRPTTTTGPSVVTTRGATAPPTTVTRWHTPGKARHETPRSEIGNSTDGDHFTPVSGRTTTTEPGAHVDAGARLPAEPGAGNRSNDGGGSDNSDTDHNAEDNGNEPTFGDWLRALRKSHNMTQLQFAERLGVPESSIRNWEASRKAPSLEKLRKLLDKNLVPESALQSAYQKFCDDPRKFPDGLPPLIPQIHNPTIYPALGTWLADIRRHRGMNQTEFAEHLGIRRENIARWEADRGNPWLENLRTIRDATGVPAGTFRTAVEHFYRDRSAADRDTPEIQEKFWELIATAPNSVDERRIQREIVEHYPYTYSGESCTLQEFIDRNTLGKTEIGQRNDIAQRVYLRIWRAVVTHNPMLGPFVRHAQATARGAVLEAYFEDKYPDLDGTSRLAVSRVNAYLTRQLGIPGGTPGVPEIAAELKLSPDRVQEALQILQQGSALSVDAPSGKGGPGWPADPSDDIADATLRLTVREALATEFEGPGLALAEELVMRHFTYGWSLADAIADLDLDITTAQAILDKARPALRSALAEPDFRSGSAPTSHYPAPQEGATSPDNSSSGGGETTATTGSRTDVTPWHTPEPPLPATPLPGTGNSADGDDVIPGPDRPTTTTTEPEPVAGNRNNGHDRSDNNDAQSNSGNGTSLGDWLRTLRKSHNMTQLEFAERLGVDKPSISRWENDSRKPSIEQLRTMFDEDLVAEDALRSVYQHFYHDPAKFPDGLPPLIPQIHNPTIYPTLGAWLADIRKHHNMTRAEFAEILEVSPSSIDRWEIGSSKPSLDHSRTMLDKDVVAETVLQSAYQHFYHDPAKFPDGLPPLIPQIHNPTIYPTLGTWLADVRKHHDMTPREFAECLGLSRPTIDDWEAGSRKPSLDQLRNLLDKDVVTETLLQPAYQHFYHDPAKFPDGLPPLIPCIDDPTIYPTLGTWLADIRKHHDMTPPEFAQLFGFTRTAIDYWEAGSRKPSLDQLRTLLAENLVPENALQSAYQHFYHDPARFPDRLPPLIPHIHDPTIYPTLGTWLADIRKHHDMTPPEFAEHLEVSRETIARWEAGQVNPPLANLRAIRDATGISTDTFRAALEYFYRDRAAHRDDPDLEEKFWELIATAPDSADERRLQLELVENYPYTSYSGQSHTLKEFIDRSIPRRSDPGQRDDVAQQVYLAIWRAVATHNPMLGSFDRHASVTARGTVLATFFQDKYPNLDSTTRRAVVTVNSYLTRRLGIPGGTPDVPEIAAELEMNPHRVQEALQILQGGPGLSVDAPAREGSRGFQLADSSDDLAEATLRLTVREALVAEFDGPDLALAVEVVMRHFSFGLPLADVIADLHLEAAAAQAILDRARPALRTALADEQDQN